MATGMARGDAGARARAGGAAPAVAGGIGGDPAVAGRRKHAAAAPNQPGRGLAAVWVAAQSCMRGAQLFGGTR